MKVSTVMIGIPLAKAARSGCTSWVLSVGAISSASGRRATTASSTGTCDTGLKGGAPWNNRSTPSAAAAAAAPGCMVM